jgi:hypothetical protein
MSSRSRIPPPPQNIRNKLKIKTNHNIKIRNFSKKNMYTGSNMSIKND